MKQYFLISKRTIQNMLLILCLIGFGTLIALNIYSANIYIENVRIRTENASIRVTWHTSVFGSVKQTEITVESDQYKNTILVPAFQDEYSFDDGEHGKLYTITIKGIYSDGTFGEDIIAQRMFLDFDQLPDIPLIKLETVNGIDPTYDEAVKQDTDLVGETIINNEYVNGSFVMKASNHEQLSSQMKIKVRGNTSSVFSDKKSYKVSLHDAMDLLNLGDNYADKEWLLLNTGTNLNTYLGSYVASYCQMEWQPQMIFVNLILNGDWKGCYLLIESVNRTVARCDISDKGYFFENDAYWWKSNGLYFKTEDQRYELGFTFKYPNIEDENDERIFILKNYMQNIESLLKANDDSVFDYIDVNTFAAWILARDIMGQGDPGGSNMYFYIHALDLDKPSSYTLKMGPLWDFDIAFLMNEGWSAQHSWDGVYSNYLMSNQRFYDVYKELWYSIHTDLLTDLSNYIDALWERLGDALEYSRYLDSIKWQNEIPSLEDEIADRKEWFRIRINWINNNI